MSWTLPNRGLYFAYHRDVSRSHVLDDPRAREGNTRNEDYAEMSFGVRRSHLSFRFGRNPGPSFQGASAVTRRFLRIGVIRRTVGIRSIGASFGL